MTANFHGRWAVCSCHKIRYLPQEKQGINQIFSVHPTFGVVGGVKAKTAEHFVFDS